MTSLFLRLLGLRPRTPPRAVLVGLSAADIWRARACGGVVVVVVKRRGRG